MPAALPLRRQRHSVHTQLPPAGGHAAATACLCAAFRLLGAEAGVPMAEPGLASLFVAAPHECPVNATSAFCLGEEVLLHAAVPPGLVGFWSFDQASPVDLSGQGRHAQGLLVTGPSFDAKGGSADFPRSSLVVPGAKSMQLHDFTYTFWFFSQDPPRQGSACSLLAKGDPSAHGNAGHGISFNPAKRNLGVAIATSDGEEAFTSNSRLRSGRWYHIALVRLDSDGQTQLFVNGILDTVHTSNGTLAPDSGPLSVGGSGCLLRFYLDEVRVYDRPLSADEIQAEASPSLSGIEPAFVRLGCTNCTLEEAESSCPAGYAVCTALELNMGGYQVAHILGWQRKGVDVWIGGSDVTARTWQRLSSFGLGLCCATD